MEPLELVRLNLLSPPVLAFALGVVATLARSDLKFPDQLYSALSMYLMLAIGLKGGAELSQTPLAVIGAPLAATLALGVITPLTAYGVLRRLGRFDVFNSAALAAHYGSVSVVTFTAALAFLQAANVSAEGFLPALVAVMEVPAILIALVLAQAGRRNATNGEKTDWGRALHEMLAGRSIVLLAGGLAIGFLSGKPGLERVAPFFVAPFQGAVALFLLEMGMVAARRLRDVRQAGAFLVGFALLAPLVHGALGAWLGTLAGLSLGGSFVLGVLAASASYIAAPAAVRVAIPEASPGYYLTASLALTFPFNLTVGLPAVYAVARLLHGQ